MVNRDPKKPVTPQRKSHQSGSMPAVTPPASHSKVIERESPYTKSQVGYQEEWRYKQVIISAATKAGQSIADYVRQVVRERAFSDLGLELPQEEEDVRERLAELAKERGMSVRDFEREVLEAALRNLQPKPGSRPSSKSMFAPSELAGISKRPGKR